MVDTLSLACKAKEECMTCEAMSMDQEEPASEGYKPSVKEELLDTSTQQDTQQDTQPDRKSCLKRKDRR